MEAPVSFFSSITLISIYRAIAIGLNDDFARLPDNRVQTAVQGRRAASGPALAASTGRRVPGDAGVTRPLRYVASRRRTALSGLFRRHSGTPNDARPTPARGRMRLCPVGNRRSDRPLQPHAISARQRRTHDAEHRRSAAGLSGGVRPAGTRRTRLSETRQAAVRGARANNVFVDLGTVAPA